MKRVSNLDSRQSFKLFPIELQLLRLLTLVPFLWASLFLCVTFQTFCCIGNWGAFSKTVYGFLYKTVGPDEGGRTPNGFLHFHLSNCHLSLWQNKAGSKPGRWGRPTMVLSDHVQQWYSVLILVNNSLLPWCFHSAQTMTPERGNLSGAFAVCLHGAYTCIWCKLGVE